MSFNPVNLTPSACAGQPVTLGYSSVTGNLSSVTTSDATQLFGYDGLLLNTEATSGPLPSSLSRTFDNQFRITSLTVNGSVIHSAYDSDSLLTQAGPLSLTRHAQHGMVSATALGGVATTQSYNEFGEFDLFTASFGGATLYRSQLGYDRAGRVVAKAETIGGATSQRAYEYDAAGRLAVVRRDGAQVAGYGYDANGNRTQVNGLTVASFDAQDRLQSHGAASYGFGANGSLQTRTQAVQASSYAYDTFGNLRSVVLPAGQIGYLVDGLNRRIGKRVNGVLVQGFVYQSALRIAAELDGSGAVVARFVHGERANVPEIMVKAGVNCRLIADHLGSVRLVVNSATGAIAQRIDYDEWGRVISDSNPGFQPFGFAGGLYDADTGLVRFGARDYDAATGRWTAKDPIGFEGETTPALYQPVGDVGSLLKGISKLYNDFSDISSYCEVPLCAIYENPGICTAANPSGASSTNVDWPIHVCARTRNGRVHMFQIPIHGKKHTSMNISGENYAT